MTRIIVAGIGGVGGYFGGLLAKNYYGHDSISVNFLARGVHLEEIQKNGLKVITTHNEFVARPNVASDKPEILGVADLIIVATKSYDLENVIQQLQPCITQHTIILPLLNGVNNKSIIKGFLPYNIVLDGCVYIVSRLKQAGVVENMGNIQTLYFGLESHDDNRFLLFENIFKQANIEANYSKNISSIIWEKFIFLSPIANATSYFDVTIGELMADPKKQNLIADLINEIIEVAKTKKILIAENIVEKTWNKLKAIPFDATSSMHTDFRSKRPNTELESLSGYVIQEAQQNKLRVPTYELVYETLRNKA